MSRPRYLPPPRVNDGVLLHTSASLFDRLPALQVTPRTDWVVYKNHTTLSLYINTTPLSSSRSFGIPPGGGQRSASRHLESGNLFIGRQTNSCRRYNDVFQNKLRFCLVTFLIKIRYHSNRHLHLSFKPEIFSLILSFLTEKITGSFFIRYIAIVVSDDVYCGWFACCHGQHSSFCGLSAHLC